MTARFKISLGITRFNLFILLHIEAVIKDRTIKKTGPLRTLPIKENSYDLKTKGSYPLPLERFDIHKRNFTLIREEPLFF